RLRHRARPRVAAIVAMRRCSVVRCVLSSHRRSSTAPRCVNLLRTGRGVAASRPALPAAVGFPCSHRTRDAPLPAACPFSHRITGAYPLGPHSLPVSGRFVPPRKGPPFSPPVCPERTVGAPSPPGPPSARKKYPRGGRTPQKRALPLPRTQPFWSDSRRSL